MKAIAILAICLLSANVFAMEKQCFGSKSDDQVSGTKFTVDIQREKVTVKGSDYAGTYPTQSSTVNGKDGVKYLAYNTQNPEEGCDTLLVAAPLLKSGGVGWVKFRCRGEGFQDSKFFCRD